MPVAAMAKRVFYTRRLRLAKWQQPYIGWLLLFVLLVPFFYFWGTRSYTPFAIAPSLASPWREAKALQEILTKLADEINLQDTHKRTIALFLEKHPVRNYKLEKISAGSCRYFFYLPENFRAPLDLWIVLPYDTKRALALLSRIFGYLELGKGPIRPIIILYEAAASCPEESLKRLLALRKKKQLIVILSAPPKESKIFNPILESIYAQPLEVQLLFTGYSPLSLPAQLGYSAFNPLFRQNPVSIDKDRSSLWLPVAGINPSNFWSQLLHLDLAQFPSASFWLNPSRQVLVWVSVTLIVLFLVLSFIPIANRILLTPAQVDLLAAVYCAIYFSLLPFLLLLLMRADAFKWNTTWGSLFLMMLGLALFYTLRYLKKRFLNIASDATSSLFLFWLILCIEAFLRPAMVYLFFLSCLTLAFVKEKKAFVAFVAFLASILWPAYVVYKTFAELHLVSLPTTEMIHLSFLIGSLIALWDRHNPVRI
ncbi:MAG: hypothetical protein NZM25_03345 [Leptospiraceae bacterium]|nr:hypothetical protein [Leptospiraceae bacterium]MDW8306022.1 hypothetical protein [Leptospiraceae bacterium]